jgi:hypothetical protein
MVLQLTFPIIPVMFHLFKRLEVCLRAEDKHFEHMLRWCFLKQFIYFFLADDGGISST